MKILSILLTLSILVSAAPIENAKKRVALTFDDGPHREYTAKILAVLEKYGVKATFFVIGQNAEQYPELIKAEFDAGHEIGNHTYSHKRLGSVDCKGMLEEIRKTDVIVYNITGSYPVLFRPPEGKTSSELEARVFAESKKTVLWTVDTRDWAHRPLEDIVKTVKNNIRNGSVILFHDYITPYSVTAEALDRLIPYLIGLGYEFVTVSELLNINSQISQ